MRIMKLNYNGNEYEFKCECKDTRHGFCHIVELYANGKLVGKSRNSYLNRTWERFGFESTIKKVVRDVDYYYDKAIESFKFDRGYSKMSNKRYHEFRRVMCDDWNYLLHREYLDLYLYIDTLNENDFEIKYY